MTIQEKSKELVWKFYHNIEHTISNEYSDKDWEIAKQCSLIAVDEILNTNTLQDRSCGFIPLCEKHTKYWQEVKKELQNV